MTARMLIATRFGLGIKDLAWFKHRLALLEAITAPSLLAQEDQRFEWILFADPDLPAEICEELEAILLPFGGRAHLWQGGRNPQRLKNWAETRTLIDNDGRVLTGRIDDDDAWDRYTVGDVHDRVSLWRRSEEPVALGYALSYANGLIWLMYDVLDIDRLHRRGERRICKASVRPFRYPFTSISGYIYGNVTGALGSLSVGHSKLPEVAKKQGCAIDVIDGGEPRWLYCRHKQTDSPVSRDPTDDLGLSLDELEGIFGIDGALTRKYIAERNRYGYSKIMRKFVERGQLVQRLRDLRAQLEKDVSADEKALLRRQETEVMASLADLTESVTVDPSDL